MRRLSTLALVLVACGSDKDPSQPADTKFSSDPSLASGAEMDDGDEATDSPTSLPGDTSTSEDITTSDATSDDSGEDANAGTVDYAADIQGIWDASCVAGCHTQGGSGMTSGGLVLTAESSYDELVGTMSVQVTTMSLVTPGDPYDSYLWHKLNGTFQDVGGLGLSMPLGTKLPQDKLDLIETWILEGAQP